MNTYLLNFIKPAFTKFIKEANEEVLKEVLWPNFSQGASEFFSALSGKEDAVTFQTQFPANPKQLPLFCFVLGNLAAPLPLQTYSYTNDEYEDEEYLKYLRVAKAGWVRPEAYSEDSNVPESLTNINLNNFIYETSVIIACYANNKTEVSWLMLVMDYLIKMYSQVLAAQGIIDISTSQTDLRLRQELFPLDVPTRIITATFKYEKPIPILSGDERHILADFDVNLRTNYE